MWVLEKAAGNCRGNRHRMIQFQGQHRTVTSSVSRSLGENCTITTTIVGYGFDDDVIATGTSWIPSDPHGAVGANRYGSASENTHQRQFAPDVSRIWQSVSKNEFPDTINDWYQIYINSAILIDGSMTSHFGRLYRSGSGRGSGVYHRQHVSIF
jgi:hypothetical protein